MENELKTIIDNMYMLGGSRGTIEGDQQYKDRCIEYLMKIHKQEIQKELDKAKQTS